MFHFLMVNRGRYLCHKHGGFCDSSDNFLDHCPLCKTCDPPSVWEVNKIDRALQIVGNLQKRSQRSVAIVTGLVGLLGLANLLRSGQLGPLSIERNGEANFVVVLCFLLLLVSIALFLISMSHMKVTSAASCWKNDAKFDVMELVDWEKSVAKFLCKSERFHKCGNLFFGMAVLFLALAFFWDQFLSDHWSAWQYRRMTQ